MKIVITKNISRCGRDSLKILSALEQLKETNSRVIVETEEIDTEKTDSRLMISIIEAFDRRKTSQEVVILSGEISNALSMAH